MKSFLLCLLLVSSEAFAARAGSELSHSLTHGEGVVSPAIDGAIHGTNPAGLIYNTGTKILGHVASSGGNSDTPDFGGHLFLGNGSVGAGVGYRRSASTLNLVDYGLGLSIDGINSAIGLGGTTRISNGASGSDLNLGYLYGPNSTFTFGASLYGVLDRVDTFGVGVAGDAASNVTLGVDAISSTSLDSVGFKPFIGFHVQEAQLGLGYGFGERVNDGISIGLSFRLGRSIQLTGYYQQFSEYYLGLLFRL